MGVETLRRVRRSSDRPRQGRSPSVRKPGLPSRTSRVPSPAGFGPPSHKGRPRQVLVSRSRPPARSRHDHGMRFRGSLAAELHDKAAHAGIPPTEAVVIDEVLPDRHDVTAPGEGRLDQLPVGLAAAGGGARLVGGGQAGRLPRAAGGPPKSVDTPLAGFGAGGRRSGQPSRPNARTCCCLSSPKMLVMSAGRPQSPPPPSTSWGAATSLAGFQVSTTGRYVEHRIMLSSRTGRDSPPVR